MADALGPPDTTPAFADLFPAEGQPAVAPAQLALVTVFPFAEGLADRQAADAVRGRLDGKYARCLALADPGFDASVRCAFRARLLDHGAEARRFDALLGLALVGETRRHALDALAPAAPDWRAAWVPEAWSERSARRCPDRRRRSSPRPTTRRPGTGARAPRRGRATAPT